MPNSVRLKVVFNYLSNVEISKMGEKPCEGSERATEWARIGLGGNWKLFGYGITSLWHAIELIFCNQPC